MASAANTIPAQEHTSAPPASPSSRPNPVALEVAVIATGTRPSDVPGQRDLFTEETSTVLVFKDGAVIRLSSAVALGQLVFLTNKQTKREVVCQVLRKRTFRPMNCYVELDFTEDMPDFWGVEFPAEPPPAGAADSSALPEISPVPTPAEAAQELVASAETTSDDVGPEPAAPTLEEVDHLRQEVEALRSQLTSLLSTNAAEASQSPSQPVAPPVSPVLTNVRSETPEWARVVTDAVLNKVASEEAQHQIMPVNEPAPVTPVQVSIPAPAPDLRVAPKKPAPFAEEEEAITAHEAASTEELLPQPALDFSRVPQIPAPSDRTDALAAGLRTTAGKIKLVLVAVLFLAVGVVGARFALPFLSKTKSAAQVSATSPTIQAAKSASTDTPAVATPSSRSDAPQSNSSAPPVPADPSTTPATISDSNPSDTPAAPDTSSSPSNGSPAAKRSNPSDSASSSTRALARRSRSESKETETPSSETLASDANIAPAKLLKSVPAVYPPDAMRNYITGDVILDAVVLPSGHVGDMKATTGPAPLRQAAMDALKQYQYAPAIQAGKPVQSHITITIKFWFDP
ncbi:MAG TPA: TonB family protein [Candidatus Acidoferrum sp.]